jgi:hypothetical protein
VAIAPLVRAAALFEINIGVDRAAGDVVAWVSVDSTCNYVVLGLVRTAAVLQSLALTALQNGANVCSRSFVLAGEEFTLEGCGCGQAFVRSVDGSTFVFCTSFGEPDQTLFHCS